MEQLHNSMMIKDLREYQVTASERLQTSKRMLLCDEMRLGKTVTALDAAIKSIKRKNPSGGSLLIVCPTNATAVWIMELQERIIAEDCEMLLRVYRGTATQRTKKMKEWEAAHQVYFEKNRCLLSVMITTYAMVREMCAVKWDVVIADEIHTGSAGLMGAKNKNWHIFDILINRTGRSVKEKAEFKVEYVFLLTGTPIRQGATDLQAPLALINPNGPGFSSYWGFVNRWCRVIDGPFGKEVLREPKDIMAFKQMLSNHMVRRKREEVFDQLPTKQRIPFVLEMSKLQQKVYTALIEEGLYWDEDMKEKDEEPIVATSAMVVINKCLQLLISPMLLGLPEVGPAMQALLDQAEQVEPEQKIVIFTPFREAVRILSDMLNLHLGYDCYELMGAMKDDKFGDNVARFAKPCVGGQRKALICTIQSGAAFSAATADHCYFLGRDWSYHFNLQAEDRLFAPEKKNFSCTYFLYLDTFDDDVIERVNDKQFATDWIVGTDDDFERLKANLSKNARFHTQPTPQV